MTRSNASLLLLTSIVLLSGCRRSAPLPGALSAVGSTAAEQGLVAYGTELKPDLQNASLTGRTVLRFIGDEQTSDSVSIVLNRGLHIEEISGRVVRSHRMDAGSPPFGRNRTTVHFTEGLEPGEEVELVLTYSGAPAFPESGINRITPDWVELNLDSDWHPRLLQPHRFVGTLRVDLPREWTVVSSGESNLEGGVHVVRNMIAQPDVAFVAAPSLRRTSSGGFTVYFTDADRDRAAETLQAAAECRDYLDNEFGSIKLLPAGKIVLADRPTGGYARTNYFVLRRVDPDPVWMHRYLCHELAHYWSDTAATPADQWMFEAFAEYVAGRSLRQRFGNATFEAYVEDWEEGGREGGPIWTPDMTRRPPDPAIYSRAPFLLSQLEARIGAERFDRWVYRYMTGAIETTSELLENLREVAGEEAEQWLRTGLAGEAPVQ